MILVDCSLEAALWAFCFDDDSFRNGILAAVNLGDDADTTAAIYGQLAGAYYGYNDLPRQWLFWRRSNSRSDLPVAVPISKH
ncbi:unnamed protein product [Rotaria sp. Silwood1]|nr:unnamed protein product [Rotaria sp. Silwood1]